MCRCDHHHHCRGPRQCGSFSCVAPTFVTCLKFSVFRSSQECQRVCASAAPSPPSGAWGVSVGRSPVVRACVSVRVRVCSSHSFRHVFFCCRKEEVTKPARREGKRAVSEVAVLAAPLLNLCFFFLRVARTLSFVFTPVFFCLFMSLPSLLHFFVLLSLCVRMRSVFDAGFVLLRVKATRSDAGEAGDAACSCFSPDHADSSLSCARCGRFVARCVFFGGHIAPKRRNGPRCQAEGSSADEFCVSRCLLSPFFTSFFVFFFVCGAGCCVTCALANT